MDSTTRLGDWYANLIHIGRRQLVLAVSERTFLPVVVTAAPIALLVPRLRLGLSQLLGALGIANADIANEDAAMEEVAYGKTASRQVTGVMVDFAKALPFYVDDTPSLLGVSLRLAETPCSPLYDTSVSPDDTTIALAAFDDAAAWGYTLMTTSRWSSSSNIGRLQDVLVAPRSAGARAASSYCALGAFFVESHAMGLLTFGLNVTLDGCIDHTQAIADDELHDYWTQLMDQSGAMLFGRNTYELMEGAWPAVARDEKAPRAMREWAQKLEAKAKYVVSGSRSDFPWQNTIKVEGDLREAISAVKAKTERGVLVGAPKLAAALEELGLIDEYRIVVHPIISGRGPTLFHGLSSARHLELLSTQRFKSGVQAVHFRRKTG